MKTITHIDTQRTEGIVNPLMVQESFSFSEMEYKQFIYELGLRFLNEFYAEDTASIEIVERTVHYWKWFKSEHLQWEKLFINEIEKENLIAKKSDYLYIMQNVITDKTTFESYLTFLKLYKDKLRCQSI